MPLRFCQLDEILHCGSGPAHAEDVDELVKRGIDAVVCLQTDLDLRQRGLTWDVMWRLYAVRRIATARVPVIDFDRRDLARQLDLAVAALAHEVAAGRRTFIHCTAGLNRSPTAVIAYLMLHRGLSRDAALAWLMERHTAAEPYPDVLTRFAKAHKLPLTGP